MSAQRLAGGSKNPWDSRSWSEHHSHHGIASDDDHHDGDDDGDDNDDDDGDEDGDDDDAKSMTIRHQCSAQENGCNTQRSDLLVPFVDLTLRELHHHHNRRHNHHHRHLTLHELHHHRGHRHIKLDLA